MNDALRRLARDRAARAERISDQNGPISMILLIGLHGKVRR
jgi:hypothetical protein